MSDQQRRDDATIARLRAGLDELTAGVRPDPPVLCRSQFGPERESGQPGLFGPAGVDGGLSSPIEPESQAPADDKRRRWVPLGAAAAAVLVATAGTVLWFDRRDDSSLGTAEPASTTTPSTPSTAGAAPETTSDDLGNPGPDLAATPLPVPAVPDGWDVIEWGDVRLAVPGEWGLTDDRSGCWSVRIGTSINVLHLGCADIYLSILPLADDSAEPTDVLNGIPVADIGGDGCIGCSQFLSSPVWGGQVGIAVGVENENAGEFEPAGQAVADQIRDSITVSGRWRAANEPLPPIPDEWVEIEHLGVTMSVPSSWIVRQAHPGEIDPDVCGSGGMVKRTVLLERGVFVVGDQDPEPDCPPWTPVSPAVDGVRIYRADDRELGPRSGDPGIWRVVTDANDDLDDGDGDGDDGNGEIIVRIGMGADPTVGLAVLNSLRSAAPIRSVGTDVPATAPADDEQVYRTVALVLEVGDAGPMMCFSALFSRPPQCSGPRLAGWDWTMTPDGSYESEAGVRWGSFVLTGTWDERSRTFTLSEESRPATEADQPPTDTLPPDDDPTADPAIERTEFVERFAGIIVQDPAILDAHVDQVGRRVIATVVAPDAALQAEYDERYGPGVIVLRPHLHPVGDWPS